MSARLAAALPLAVALLLSSAPLGCTPARTPAAEGAPAIAAAPVAHSLDTGPRATIPASSVDTLTTSETGLVDVAPGQVPSAALPAGSVYLAAVVFGSERDPDARIVTVWEWDVAGARALHTARLPRASPGGTPATVRIAATTSRIYVTTELAGGGAIQLDAMNRALETTASRIVGAGSEVSLEADERSIAVAFRPSEPRDTEASRHLDVEVYDPASLGLVARTRLGATSMFSGVSLPDAIELHAGRLFVVGVVGVVGVAGVAAPRSPRTGSRESGASPLGATTVFALELPSLRIDNTFTTGASPHYQSRMLHRGGDLIFSGGGTLVALTPELHVVSEEELDGDAPAFGPRGGVLRRHGTDDTATCTPAWASAQPLLACGLRQGGARVVRLGAAR